MREGMPIDTSMGYSPLEGLIMATRPGDIDAGLILALQQQEGRNAAQVESLLNTQSGLLGVSAHSGDMRTLLASNEPRSQLAVAMYCYRVRKYIGAYLAALGGADAILIGGGVGEHLPAVRARIFADMQWAGIAIDATLNAAAIGVPARVDAQDSRIAIHITPVNEEKILFDEVSKLLHTA
jgi:acetate kinase